MMGGDSDTGGDGFRPFYVAGDCATRNDIAPHPDAIPLADFNAWAIDPIRTAEIRAAVGDRVHMVLPEAPAAWFAATGERIS